MEKITRSIDRLFLFSRINSPIPRFEANKITPRSRGRKPRGNLSARINFENPFYLVARVYDTDHQCCPRDRQQDIFCSFELRRVPFRPTQFPVVHDLTGIGEEKNERPPKTGLPRSRIRIYSLDGLLFSGRGGEEEGRKKKARKDRRVSRIKIVSTFIQCARRDARPPTVSCVATERRRDARTRPRTTENVETTPGVSTTINTIRNT